jgi:hypothetical protein
LAYKNLWLIKTFDKGLICRPLVGLKSLKNLWLIKTFDKGLKGLWLIKTFGL